MHTKQIKNMRLAAIFLLLVLSQVVAATDYDLDKPFGFCTRYSRTNSDSIFHVTGGGCYTYPIPKSFTGKVVVLTSTGHDMKAVIQKAINDRENDIIIFDGSAGDFIVSSKIRMKASDKTLLGIHNARLRTQFYVTDELKNILDAAGVPHMITSRGTGGTLTNGQTVSEEAEYNTRKIIIGLTDDDNETYRDAGIFVLNGCRNVIIRNLTFIGPGAIDVGGSDLLTCVTSKNCWIDHCTFMDGMDGNFDITLKSDFITVSWCAFSYSHRSYMHQNTNLVGSSDREETGYLNTTYAFNWWGMGCKQRMPMARVGKIHMLNNYYSCTTASHAINPRKSSEFLIEGNYFDKGVKRFFSTNDAIAVTWASDNYSVEKNKMGMPHSTGSTVTVPYEYTVAPCADIPNAVRTNAGATLKY